MGTRGVKSQSRAKTRAQGSFPFNHEVLRSHERGQIILSSLWSTVEKKASDDPENIGSGWAEALGRPMVVSKVGVFRRKGKDGQGLPMASVTWSH